MKTQEPERLVSELEKQVALVVEEIKKEPSKKKQILIRYISNFYEAVKKTVEKEGSITPHYVMLTDPPNIGVPRVTDEVVSKAKELNAEAVLSVEGFRSENDISDVVYHVSMSAPCMGVLGWVFKVKLSDTRVDIAREMPYFFDVEDKVKTLGQLVVEMEAGEEDAVG
jgi:hypothetical protein